MRKFRGFDTRAIKQFFILNVEKIVFGGSMLLVAFLIYSGISQKKYPNTPQELQTSIASAKQNIEKLADIPAALMPKEPKYKEVASRAQDQVPASGFLTPTPLHTDSRNKIGARRGAPVLLAVRDLETTAGTGPFVFKGDPTQRFAVDPALAAGQQAQPGAAPGQFQPQARPQPQPTRRPPPRSTRGGGGLQDLLSQQEGAAPAGGEGMLPGMGGLQGGAAGPRGIQATQGSVVEGVRWICVTGLVPYKEQVSTFEDEFSNAQLQDPAKDFPVWAGYLVERSEVTSEDLKDPSKAKWHKISVSNMLQLTKTWSARAGDVVDPSYTSESLTFPLGPLLERNWGKEVGHSKIPLLDISVRGSGAAAEVASETGALADSIVSAAEGDDLSAMRNRRNTTTANVPGGEGAAPGARTIAPRAMPGGRFAGGEEGLMPGGPRGMAGMQGEGVGGYSTGTTPQELENLMFRFFDFTVEEGKRYRYRVQLVLVNPNWQIRPQYLKDAKLAVDELLKSPMSEPSPPASVPTFNMLLAGEVTAADKPIDEPKVKLIAVQLDPKLGTKAVYEMRNPIPGDKKDQKRPMRTIPRGQAIHFQADVGVVHPLTQKVEEKSLEFNSGQVVIDIRGGERFTTVFNDPETTPGEVLFMDANGWLTSRSEATDELDYQAEVAWLAALKAAQESNSTAPAGGLPGEGGEGVPLRGRGAGGEQP